jgi:hypothetical protein
MASFTFEVEVQYPIDDASVVADRLQSVLCGGSEWGDGFEARVIAYRVWRNKTNKSLLDQTAEELASGWELERVSPRAKEKAK